jgi:RNA polymerase sigma-70 factor (ECF subfamily)
LPALHKESDEALIEYLRSGNAEALAELFDRHSRVVFGVAFRILRDRGEAEDLMQDVFLEIYRDAARFDPVRGSVRTWLLQYAYHRSLNRKKYLQRRSFYEFSEARAESAAARSEDVPGRNAEELLRSGIEQLNERERRTIEMVCFEGLTLREISERTREALANTRNYYYRGVKKLRALLFRAPKTNEEIGRARR